MSAPPSFVSLAFHTRFFPSVLWRRLRPRPATTTSPFADHVPLEYPIVLALSVVIAVLGLAPAVTRGSVIGGVVGTLGAAGAIALVVQSVLAQLGTRPTFDAFHVGVFLLACVLGLTGGFLLGGRSHVPAVQVASALAGLAAGYALGIAGGLSVQRLGWVAAWVELASGLAALGLVVVDLVLIFG